MIYDCEVFEFKRCLFSGSSDKFSNAILFNPMQGGCDPFAGALLGEQCVYIKQTDACKDIAHLFHYLEWYYCDVNRASTLMRCLFFGGLVRIIDLPI